MGIFIVDHKYLSHLKKCTAIICVSSFHLFSVNYFILTKSLNQLLTIVYFIYSVLVVKWVRKEIHFFLIKIHKLTMCKIHCIVRDMSSSIISVSLLATYLKRATYIWFFLLETTRCAYFLQLTLQLHAQCIFYINLHMTKCNVYFWVGFFFIARPNNSILNK